LELPSRMAKPTCSISLTRRRLQHLFRKFHRISCSLQSYLCCLVLTHLSAAVSTEPFPRQLTHLVITALQLLHRATRPISTRKCHFFEYTDA
jgi:hypothetical protein